MGEVQIEDLNKVRDKRIVDKKKRYETHGLKDGLEVYKREIQEVNRTRSD